jgi:hypothetical protein
VRGWKFLKVAMLNLFNFPRLKMVVAPKHVILHHDFSTPLTITTKPPDI